MDEAKERVFDNRKGTVIENSIIRSSGEPLAVSRTTTTSIQLKMHVKWQVVEWNVRAECNL